MKPLRVLDTDIETVQGQSYDFALFASGYESRCVYVQSLLDPKSVSHPLVCGFVQEANHERRKRHDEILEERWKCRPTLVDSNDEKPIYTHLSKYACNLQRSIRILVDYSSMSRLWYTAVLNWARFASAGKEVVIDFVYAIGQYAEAEQDMVIREMVSLPGCEGRAYRLRESVAVFGLGFQGLATLCVLDQLEADTVYAFLASPGVSDDYVLRAKQVNGQLISNRKMRAVVDFPLGSVESSYRGLAEIIAPHRTDGEITLVPMGPKPHVLASVLVAMRFPEVACLRVSGAPDPRDVQVTGDVVATRVVIPGNPEAIAPDNRANSLYAANSEEAG